MVEWKSYVNIGEGVLIVKKIVRKTKDFSELHFTAARRASNGGLISSIKFRIHNSME